MQPLSALSLLNWLSFATWPPDLFQKCRHLFKQLPIRPSDTYAMCAVRKHSKPPPSHFGLCELVQHVGAIAEVDVIICTALHQQVLCGRERRVDMHLGSVVPRLVGEGRLHVAFGVDRVVELPLRNGSYRYGQRENVSIKFHDLAVR